MEQKEKYENQVSEKKDIPVNKNNSKTLFWILGGCLALLIISGLAIGGLAYWSYKKVKDEIKKNQFKVEQRQAELKKTEEQAGQNKEQSESTIEGTSAATPLNENYSEESSRGLPENSEKQMGYIKKVYEKNGKHHLDIDYIQWLTGAAAEKAMREDEECPKAGECIVLNDYYIRNVNPLIRTFEIAPDAEFLMQTFSAGEAGGDISWNQPISYDQFKNIFITSAKPQLKNVPYIVEIGNKIIIKITEQYIP
jgi:hypothetical protein